jgi:transcriptional regulator with XRE-family HTH domain
MTSTTNDNPPRLLSPKELGLLIVIMRDARKWSQEVLAELSRLSVRTIQRIEKGEPASTETKRALAYAFGCEDLDQFDKPTKVMTAKEIEDCQKEIEKQYLTLKATLINSGRQLADFASQMNASLFTCDVIVQGQAEADLAQLMDYVREYSESAELYSETDKLAIYSDFQGLLDRLKANNISLCCALRKGNFSNTNVKHLPMFVLYMTAFTKGKEPDTFLVEKSLSMK